VNHASCSLTAAVDRLEAAEIFAAREVDPTPSASDTCNIGSLMAKIDATRLASTTLLDRLGLPTYYCVRPSARHPLAVYSSGKGLSDDQAKISSVFECYERWAAERCAFEAVATYDEIASFAAQRDIAIVRRAEERAGPIRWAFGKHILTSQIAAAPSECVEFPSLDAMGPITTTGLAAHTADYEAIRAGFFECVERHYAAHMCLEDLRRLSLDECPLRLQSLANAFRDNEIELHAFLIASAPICFVVYCYTRDDWLGLPQMHCSGFGASDCLFEAIERAVLEIVQGRAAFITGLRDDVRLHVAAGAIRMNSTTQLDWLQRLRNIREWSVERTYSTSGRTWDSFFKTVAQMKEESPAKTPICFPLRTVLGLPAVRILVPELDDCF
jgi:YcaO-like protein with predicted kinase domain